MTRAKAEATPRWLAALGWAAFFGLPAMLIALAPAGWPAWAVMWSLAAAIFAGCKGLSWAAVPKPAAPWWRHAGYLGAWPGLDAASFLDDRPLPDDERPPGREWALAATRLLAGAALLWGVARLLPADAPLARGWVGMVGLIMVLHFGALHLISCGWRRTGVRARPLMQRPLRSRSLGEFWGRRWNTAFRDLTHRFLFKPLTQRLGGTAAIAVGFLFSGLVHDLVISWPAGGGYGRPTLYFALQGAGLVVERSRVGRRLGLGRGWRGRALTFAVLGVPLAPLLFHPPFVYEVIVPFMRAIAAL